MRDDDERQFHDELRRRIVDYLASGDTEIIEQTLDYIEDGGVDPSESVLANAFFFAADSGGAIHARRYFAEALVNEGGAWTHGAWVLIRSLERGQHLRIIRCRDDEGPEWAVAIQENGKHGRRATRFGRGATIADAVAEFIDRETTDA